MAAKPMPKVLPTEQVGKRWETPLNRAGESVPSGSQLPFLWDAEVQRHADTSALRALFRAALARVGGEVWLASALQKPLAYASKISEAVNAIGDRKIQLDWFAPLLQDPRAQDLVVEWMCDRCGYEQPRRRAEPTPAELAAARAEVLAEMGLLETIDARVRAKTGRSK